MKGENTMYIAPKVLTFTQEELNALQMACASPCNCRGYCPGGAPTNG